MYFQEMNSNPATITHEEVHVSIDKSSNGPAVISTQPTTVGYNASSSDIIVTDQPAIAVVSQGKPDGKRKPKDFVVTSCFVIMLCNFIFGLLAYHFGGIYINYYFHIHAIKHFSTEHEK